MNNKIFKIISFIFLIISCVLLFNNYNIITIQGDSMFPTYKAKSIHLLKKRNNNIDRFDIIVFKLNEKDTYIKRVIALPGETITCKNGIVYVNDINISDQFAKITDDFSPITLQQGEYFVMGDNRKESTDSRTLGPILKKDIVGKILK